MSSALANITVAEVMSIKVHSISSDKTVEQAYNLMNARGFGGLPVVDDEKLAGIITRKDVGNIKFEKRAKTKVKDVMTKQVLTTVPEEKVSIVLEKMSELRVMRMPVISKTGALIGVITLADIDKASKTLKNRKFDEPTILKCPNCSAPLAITINRTVTCQHCGHVLSV